MGGGRSGRGPVGRTGSSSRLRKNLERARREYGFLQDGAIRMTHRKSNLVTGRRYASDPHREARQMFNVLAHGGRKIRSQNGNRITAYFRGGSVTYMKRSGSDKSPTVQIHWRKAPGVGPRRQKIHFVKEKK
jgi:hypothetical protein